MAVQGGWSRRAVLGAVGGVSVAGVLSGCSWLSGPPDPPPPDPLVPMLAATRVLIDQYQQALTDHPELADQLAPLQQSHLAHEEALRELTGTPAPASGSPHQGEWAPPTSEASDPTALVDQLREAEQRGEVEATEACLSAPPHRVALLGSIAAARATHVAVLA